MIYKCINDAKLNQTYFSLVVLSFYNTRTNINDISIQKGISISFFYLVNK